MLISATRVAVAGGRWLVATMLCALGAHAVASGSLFPGDGLHGYFGWYVPVLTVGTVFALAAIVVAALAGNSRVVTITRVLLPARPSQRKARSVAALASSALAFLLVQESLERSLETSTFTIATFTASTWPMLIVVLGLAAFGVLAIGRSVVALCDVRVQRRPARRATTPLLQPVPARRSTARTTPLARHAGLRAPPLPA